MGPRFFFALWPDPATRAALTQLQAGLAGNLQVPGKLHLTLAFLGQRAETDLLALRRVLRQVPARAMTLELDRYGHFGGQRIAWAGPSEAPEQLLALRAALMRLLAADGFAPEFEADRFRPHVTLARKAPAPAAAGFAPLRWRADELVLATSPGTLSGTDEGYRIVASRRLA
ncbi:RNA 2',3'-cyclic phosphodiesterase [Janthinobacterium fluminis]|uniref:RNA 2',3'-cyclic phosphodiesterase n=1 Tax=Janthinobacterium fluminis TaxID=2987524 RepID=A0ABT5K5B4_9BURK|nr:RNA 2',3'-cyclic phosphodiesterase [Janthinobacterium fluminis]MDC8759640.1 RNA 2',3'-cyclic phosphodiesterase [Janthinobacterium fluminis]